MSFPFHNRTKQKLSLSFQTESIAIGCEAWIDVGRFCAAEQSACHATKPPSSASLTRSFADIRRKFRKSSNGAID